MWRSSGWAVQAGWAEQAAWRQMAVTRGAAECCEHVPLTGQSVGPRVLHLISLVLHIAPVLCVGGDERAGWGACVPVSVVSEHDCGLGQLTLREWGAVR